MILLLSEQDLNRFSEDSNEHSKVTNYFGQKGKILERPLYGIDSSSSHEDPSSFQFIFNKKVMQEPVIPIYKRNHKIKGIKCLNDKQYIKFF